MQVRFDFLLVVAVILIAVFEGAVRKWIAPGLTTPLLLLRDVAAFTLVLRAVLGGAFRVMPGVTRCLVAWTFCVTCWGVFQIVVLQGPPVLFALGMRFWLLYFWFALAMACSLSTSEVVSVMRLMIVLGVAMTPLVVLQHFLPPSSVLNVQPDTEEDQIFLVIANVVRVSGTFTFTLGFACFIAVVTPIAISTTWSGVRLYPRRWMALAGYVAVAISTLVSGSRASIMFFVGMLALQTLAGFGAARTGGAVMRSAAKVVVGLIAVAITLNVFSDAVQDTMQRFKSAGQGEDIVERIETELVGEPAARKDIDFLGHGLGAGTNAGSVLLTGENAFALAESEPARVMLEMGAVGFVWLVIKCVMFAAGLAKSAMMLAHNGESLPLLMWAATAYGMSSWPVSGQVSANAFGFLALGLALCSIRTRPVAAETGERVWPLGATP
ncbi:hypothetical protein [Paraburkholderia dinghuensis]|uniref:O-antigen ligase domain-containing protein n=1 Tax=Paraburkholderia dinghuensis TaxID=2305225 RepID=A0A3N6N3H8_9BURK|nr:hypothetical protein [Paraburkholderia dinghuensis]RQH02197.1 hypothetical protein D1Y85_22200 [Paraburkholderia dinghuensis]